jgi:uncharacterized membrane protein YqaE (UPF0057 family)
MKPMLVNVLLPPVAIWMRALGFLAARLFSRLVMAPICAGQSWSFT